jgi:hypothetical protein
MTRQRASLEGKSLSVVFGAVVVLSAIANSASAAAQPCNRGIPSRGRGAHHGRSYKRLDYS